MKEKEGTKIMVRMDTIEGIIKVATIKKENKAIKKGNTSLSMLLKSLKRSLNKITILILR